MLAECIIKSVEQFLCTLDQDVTVAFDILPR